MLYRAVLEQWCDVRVTAQRRVDFGELPEMSLIDHHRIKLQDIRFFTYEIRIRYKAISTFCILNASVKDGMRDQPCMTFHISYDFIFLFFVSLSFNIGIHVFLATLKDT